MIYLQVFTRGAPGLPWAELFQTIKHNDRPMKVMTITNRCLRIRENSSQKRMRQSVTMAIVQEEGEEVVAQKCFVRGVSLTGFDDDKGCFRGKQHQSVKILGGLGTPEDQVCAH